MSAEKCATCGGRMADYHDHGESLVRLMKEVHPEAYPKPVGREGSERITLHREPCDLPGGMKDWRMVECRDSKRTLCAGVKHIEVVPAAALDAALREREAALKGLRDYQKAYDDSRRENDRCYAKISDEGFQIADLQRRLDEAVGLLNERPTYYQKSTYEWDEKCKAFLARERGGE